MEHFKKFNHFHAITYTSFMSQTHAPELARDSGVFGVITPLIWSPRPFEVALLVSVFKSILHARKGSPSSL